jgi:hypothetical protein
MICDGAEDHDAPDVVWRADEELVGAVVVDKAVVAVVALVALVVVAALALAALDEVDASVVELVELDEFEVAAPLGVVDEAATDVVVCFVGVEAASAPNTPTPPTPARAAMLVTTRALRRRDWRVSRTLRGGVWGDAMGA